MDERWKYLLENNSGFAGDGKPRFFSSPGRTELGGNHCDHQGGRVLCATIGLDIRGVFVPNKQRLVHLNSRGWPRDIIVELGSLSPREEEKGHPEALVRGVASALDDLGAKLDGFSGSIDSAIPVGSGLSSSAAFELLIAQAFNAMSNNSTLEPLELAMAGQQAENCYFGKPSGLMDQLSIALGGLQAIDFGSEIPVTKNIDFNLDEADWKLAVLHGGIGHEKLTEHYAAIPEEMVKVAGFFGQKRLRGIKMEDLLQNSSVLRSSFGDRAFMRAMHFVEEDERAGMMARRLESGNFTGFLELVAESGASSERLLQNIRVPGGNEQALGLAIELARFYLGRNAVVRVHGGGFAGTAQAWVKKEQATLFEEFFTGHFGHGSLTWLSIKPQGAMELFL